MKYQRTNGTQGAWVKASEVVSGTKAKIVSETAPVDGNFGTQDVAKVRFQGAQEAVNVGLNRTTINGLIDAFGDDSKSWINQILTAQTEKQTIAGKRVTVLYLVPEGFEVGEDEGGYVKIMKTGTQVTKAVQDDDIPVIETEKINLADIPF